MPDIDLSGLNEKQIDALLSAINSHKRTKKDFANMTDAERAWVNRTVEPVTPQVPHQEFPKVVYGAVKGQVVATTIRNHAEEDDLHEKYPDARWGSSPLAHGIETCPSKPAGTVQAGFITIGGVPPGFNPAIEVKNDPVPEAPKIPDLAAQERMAHARAAKQAKKQAA